jgi:3-oxocholest-4-en-26-oyl-CoA dehydrogenase alpha subunit
VVAWAADTGVIDRPWVRLDLAKCHALLDAMHLLNWKLTVAVAEDELNPADASAVKVYGTEAVIEVYHLLLGILGSAGYLREGSPGAVLSGRVEQSGRSAQINTFGGGVNEVQREIVAWMGLGMTRGKR